MVVRIFKKEEEFLGLRVNVSISKLQKSEIILYVQGRVLPQRSWEEGAEVFYKAIQTGYFLFIALIFVLRVFN